MSTVEKLFELWRWRWMEVGTRCGVVTQEGESRG